MSRCALARTRKKMRNGCALASAPPDENHDPAPPAAPALQTGTRAHDPPRSSPAGFPRRGARGEERVRRAVGQGGHSRVSVVRVRGQVLGCPSLALLLPRHVAAGSVPLIPPRARVEAPRVAPWPQVRLCSRRRRRRSGAGEPPRPRPRPASETRRGQESLRRRRQRAATDAFPDSAPLPHRLPSALSAALAY
jgi:hypothetical protein